MTYIVHTYLQGQIQDFIQGGQVGGGRRPERGENQVTLHQSMGFWMLYPNV